MSCFMVINGSCSTNMCARQLSFNFSSMFGGHGPVAPLWIRPLSATNDGSKIVLLWPTFFSFCGLHATGPIWASGRKCLFISMLYKFVRLLSFLPYFPPYSFTS